MTLLEEDGRLLIIALDHGLYSWPNPGLEDRRAVIEASVAGGADALIASYGTIRDLRDAFGSAKPILKLDTTVLSIGSYQDAPYRLAWTVEDAQRLGAAAVLTYVQVGSPNELDDLQAAGRIAAEADRAGLPYVCEIMPVGDATPAAIAACVRAGAELGAHLVKTTIPIPASGLDECHAQGVPIVLAGGDLSGNQDALFATVEDCLAHGASGVAFGRNAWGSGDLIGTVRRLHGLIHS